MTDPIQRGEGARVSFDGVDLTQAPYHTYLTDASKYWFLNFTSKQIQVGPTSLISTKSTIDSWVIPLELRIEPPDFSRHTMLAAMTALAGVLDPTKGECRLILGEFPGSFFMAKAQKGDPTKDEHSMASFSVDFACTGPSYSLIESIQENPLAILDNILVTAGGDSIASPRYRITTAVAYSGDISIENTTTGERVLWNGTLAAHDVLDFIIDSEYGTPYTVLLNGANKVSTVVGPAWPHLKPGYNYLLYSGPASGTLETRWRDRWLVGQHYPGQVKTKIVLTVDAGTPHIGQSVNFNVYLTLADGTTPVPLKQVKIFHYLNGVEYTDYTGYADVNGHIAFSQVFNAPGNRPYFARFSGDESYAAAESSAVTIDITVQTRLTFSDNYAVTGGHGPPERGANTQGYLSAPGQAVTFKVKLEWLDITDNVWKTGAIIDKQRIKIWHTLNGIDYVDVGDGLVNVTGDYTLTQTFADQGLRVYHAEYAGASGYKPSTGTIIYHDVNRPTKLTLVCSDTTPAVNQQVTFSGKLYTWMYGSASWADGSAGYSNGKVVRIGHRFNDVWYNDSNLTSDSTAWFSINQTFASAGVRYYQAIFPAGTTDDATLQSCYSDGGTPLTITVG